MESNIKAGYKIVDIQTIQFATFNVPDVSDTDMERFGMHTSYSYGIDTTQNLFSCKLEILIQVVERPVIKIETQATYELSEKTFLKLIDRDCFNMPVVDVSHFTSILYGATRGILVCKLENSPLRQIILPPINLHDVITHPLRIKLYNEL